MQKHDCAYSACECKKKYIQGVPKMVDHILNTHISETTWWIVMKHTTIYVEGHKFYWLSLQRKVQIFVGSVTDFNKCSIWAPPVPLYTSSRYSSSCQTRCSMSSITVSSAGVILCFISSMLAGRGGTKTCPFTEPLRKKSLGERSSDRGDQLPQTGGLRQNPQPPEARGSEGGAPSAWKFCIFLQK